MSGRRVPFVGDAMAAVVQGVAEVRTLIGQPPITVGGLAVLARLSSPYRATVDLDLVDRLLGSVPQLEVLRAAPGAEPVEQAAVLLLTPYGPVKIDVLEAPGCDESSTGKQSTDLQGIVRLTFDEATRPAVLQRITGSGLRIAGPALIPLAFLAVFFVVPVDSCSGLFSASLGEWEQAKGGGHGVPGRSTVS